MAAPRTIAAIASSLPAYTRTAGRAVHIKIHPRPLNLSESRHVLRTLQEFGDVIMYKHLKVSHRPNPDLHFLPRHPILRSQQRRSSFLFIYQCVYLGNTKC